MTLWITTASGSGSLLHETFSFQDFGDGGAFPEIHVAQYPLNMGKAEGKKNNTLALQVDAEGKIRYDAIVRQGQHKDKVCRLECCCCV